MGHCGVRVLKQRGSVPAKIDQQNDLQTGEKKMENIIYLRGRLWHDEVKAMRKT